MGSGDARKKYKKSKSLKSKKSNNNMEGTRPIVMNMEGTPPLTGRALPNLINAVSMLKSKPR